MKSIIDQLPRQLLDRAINAVSDLRSDARSRFDKKGLKRLSLLNDELMASYFSAKRLD